MGAVSRQARLNQYKTAMERYHWYKEAGICPRCCTRYSEPGMVYCKACYEKNRRKAAERDPTGKVKAQYMRERRARLKAEGICTDCAKRPAMEGKTRCKKCMERAQDSRIKYNVHQRTLKGEAK